MATLPVTAGGVNAPAHISQTAQGQGNNLANGFAGLSLFRQAGILVGLAASIAIGFAVVLWSQEPDYHPLLADMNNLDATQAVDVLKTSDILFKLDPRTGALMVPASDIHRARMALAAVGISDNPTVGFELLDREQGLGTSQFMENIAYRRGMEGEMARTISSLNSVRSSRVHLALPRTSVFLRDKREPGASVFVELAPGRRLTEEQVVAVLNLVASSVPELDSQNVTIVDQNGRLLSEQGQSESSAMAAREFEYTRKLENVLSERVKRILEPVLGRDNFNAEVSADLDFTANEQTAEIYNPNAIIRSEQTVDEQRVAGVDIGGIPGALSNQPPGAATVPEQAVAADGTAIPATAPPANTRQQATRNYELDRTISYTRQQTGQIRKLSVAVVIDDRATEGEAEGTGGWSEEELQRITSLVRGAVGYDEQRGDLVEVVNAPFTRPEIVESVIEVPAFWTEGWFQKLMRQVVAGILVLILIFAVIRPIMKSLSSTGVQQQVLASAANADQNVAMSHPGLAAGEAPGIAGTLPGAQALLPGPGQNYDAQLAAAQGMIVENPQRATQVVRQWVTDDE